MTSGHLPARGRSYATWLSALGLSITIGFAIVFAIVLGVGRDREREQAQLSVTNIVSTINSDIERNLEIYDLSLQAVADGIKLPDYGQLSPAVRQLVLFDRAATARDMGSISILDQNGIVIVNSRTLTPAPDNYADKDFFIVQKTNPAAGSFISRPWVASNGEYLIAISRRLTNADGSFAGVVIGTMRLNYFRELFGKLNLDQHDSLALIRGDGSVVMRSPFDITLIGRNIGASRVFRKIVSDQSAPFEDVSIFDRVPRLYVSQHVGNHPLTVTYGRSIDSIYAPWRQRSLRSGLIVACLCATNIALIVFLARTLRRRRDAEYALAVSATTDSLTGLCNRRRLDELLEREWRRAMRLQTTVALLMIDADHFKAFNDRFGHQSGDEALASIAGCLQNASRRAGDIAARYGGEEFAVLLPGLSLAEAVAYAEVIRSNVIELRSDQQDRPDSTPTISIGAAVLAPRRGLEPKDLIKAADLALYKAKRNGRNRTEPALAQVGGAKRSAAA